MVYEFGFKLIHAVRNILCEISSIVNLAAISSGHTGSRLHWQTSVMHVLKRPSLESPTGTVFEQVENGLSV